MTDVATTRRGSMSKKRRLRIFETHKGICCLCNTKIDGVREKWIVEHLRALGLGGEDSDDNCAPAHQDCRLIKDKDDAARIAKAKRVKARHIGITRPTGKLRGAPFPKTDKSARREQNAAAKVFLPPRSLFVRGQLMQPSHGEIDGE